MFRSELIDINKLLPNEGQVPGLPKNPRLIKDGRYKALVKSIQDDPEMLELREVIAYQYNDSLVVIGGNMRLRACQELGYKKIPVKILPQDTELKKLKAYVIKDNAPFGENDWEALANEWDQDQLMDWGLELPVVEGGGVAVEVEEQELKPFKRTHVLLSFPPERMVDIQEYLQKICDHSFVEYEQASN